METPILLVLVSIGFGALLYRFYCLSFLITLIRWHKKLKISYFNTRKKFIRSLKRKPKFLKNEQVYNFRIKDHYFNVRINFGKVKVITIADKIRDTLTPYWTIEGTWDNKNNCYLEDENLFRVKDFERLK